MLRVKRERGESSRQVDEDRDYQVQNFGDNRPSSDRDEADRRLLRCRYRALKADVNDFKGQLGEADSSKFREIFERVEDLHKLVNKPREQIADAELYVEITNELLDVAKGARRRVGMSPAEFVGAIIQNFGLPSAGDADVDPNIDWAALGMEAFSVLRDAPGVSTMVGPMDVEVKPRKAPVSRRRDRPTEKTRPQDVAEVDPNRPNSETDANMTTMFGILMKERKIELDRLIFNRVSFAQTIENLFALSFLVKDGRVEIKIMEEGKQFVVPRNAPSHEGRVDGEGINTQFVFRLDFSCWRLMGTTVLEGTEVMPHRQIAHESTSMPGTSRTPIRKNSRNRARETPLVIPELEEYLEDGSQPLKRSLASGFPN